MYCHDIYGFLIAAYACIVYLLVRCLIEVTRINACGG